MLTAEFFACVTQAHLDFCRTLEDAIKIAGRKLDAYQKTNSDATSTLDIPQSFVDGGLTTQKQAQWIAYLNANPGALSLIDEELVQVSQAFEQLIDPTCALIQALPDIAVATEKHADLFRLSKQDGGLLLSLLSADSKVSNVNFQGGIEAVFDLLTNSQKKPNIQGDSRLPQMLKSLRAATTTLGFTQDWLNRVGIKYVNFVPLEIEADVIAQARTDVEAIEEKSHNTIFPHQSNLPQFYFQRLQARLFHCQPLLNDLRNKLITCFDGAVAPILEKYEDDRLAGKLKDAADNAIPETLSMQFAASTSLNNVVVDVKRYQENVAIQPSQAQKNLFKLAEIAVCDLIPATVCQDATKEGWYKYLNLLRVFSEHEDAWQLVDVDLKNAIRQQHMQFLEAYRQQEDHTPTVTFLLDNLNTLLQSELTEGQALNTKLLKQTRNQLCLLVFRRKTEIAYNQCLNDSTIKSLTNFGKLDNFDNLKVNALAEYYLTAKANFKQILSILSQFMENLVGKSIPPEIEACEKLIKRFCNDLLRILRDNFRAVFPRGAHKSILNLHKTLLKEKVKLKKGESGTKHTLADYPLLNANLNTTVEDTPLTATMFPHTLDEFKALFQKTHQAIVTLSGVSGDQMDASMMEALHAKLINVNFAFLIEQLNSMSNPAEEDEEDGALDSPAHPDTTSIERFVKTYISPDLHHLTLVQHKLLIRALPMTEFRDKIGSQCIRHCYDKSLIKTPEDVASFFKAICASSAQPLVEHTDSAKSSASSVSGFSTKSKTSTGSPHSYQRVPDDEPQTPQAPHTITPAARQVQCKLSSLLITNFFGNGKPLASRMFQCRSVHVGFLDGLFTLFQAGPDERFGISEIPEGSPDLNQTHIRLAMLVAKRFNPAKLTHANNKSLNYARHLITVQKIYANADGKTHQLMGINPLELTPNAVSMLLKHIEKLAAPSRRFSFLGASTRETDQPVPNIVALRRSLCLSLIANRFPTTCRQGAETNAVFDAFRQLRKHQIWQEWTHTALSFYTYEEGMACIHRLNPVYSKRIPFNETPTPVIAVSLLYPLDIRNKTGNHMLGQVQHLQRTSPKTLSTLIHRLAKAIPTTSNLSIINHPEKEAYARLAGNMEGVEGRLMEFLDEHQVVLYQCVRILLAKPEHQEAISTLYSHLTKTLSAMHREFSEKLKESLPLIDTKGFNLPGDSPPPPSPSYSQRFAGAGGPP
jgi:hypothetical protein